jgi:hypothetical protein
LIRNSQRSCRVICALQFPAHLERFMATLKLPRRRRRCALPAGAPPSKPKSPNRLAKALNAFLTAIGIVGLTVTISANELPSRRILTLEAARHVAEAAAQFAERKGWPCVIAVEWRLPDRAAKNGCVADARIGRTGASKGANGRSGAYRPTTTRQAKGGDRMNCDQPGQGGLGIAPGRRLASR